MINSITNLIFELEEFCNFIDSSWEDELRKINYIYEKYGDISYMETEDNLIFIDKTEEIVGCLYE